MRVTAEAMSATLARQRREGRKLEVWFMVSVTAMPVPSAEKRALRRHQPQWGGSRGIDFASWPDLSSIGASAGIGAPAVGSSAIHRLDPCDLGRSCDRDPIKAAAIAPMTTTAKQPLVSYGR